MVLSAILFWVGYFLAPGFPNFIIREILAVFLAVFLPRAIVYPVNQAAMIIFPPVIRFEEKMRKYPRLSTIFPAFLTAEVILMALGIVLISLSRAV